MSKDQWKEVNPSVVSWGKPGDHLEGTLVDVRVREVQDDKKGLVRKNIYEIRADEGLYHAVDDKKNPVEPGVKCEAGDYFTVWGGRETIDNVMRKAKLGQKVRLVFAEEGEPKKKGYSGFKLIKGYLGVMDEEWLAQQEPSSTDTV